MSRTTAPFESVTNSESVNIADYDYIMTVHNNEFNVNGIKIVMYWHCLQEFFPISM